MHVTGHKRLKLHSEWGNEHWKPENVLSELVDCLMKSDRSGSRWFDQDTLEFECWFNCISINRQYAVSLDDAEFWAQLRRAFSTMKPLHVEHLRPRVQWRGASS
eukprot:m.36316 g.36316  ORF g.36316 m.36316 type:complete len:104 (+) comp44597_c1_seq3:94-405(+)